MVLCRCGLRTWWCCGSFRDCDDAGGCKRETLNRIILIRIPCEVISCESASILTLRAACFANWAKGESNPSLELILCRGYSLGDAFFFVAD